MAEYSIGRRQVLPGALALGAGLGLNGSARADAYPGQTVRFIIPYGPGGNFDAYVRKFSQLLQKNLPSQVNVEPINSPGDGGKEAIFQLTQDPPDGYAISIANVPGLLMTKGAGPMDLQKLTWVANLGRDSYGLAVGKNSAVKNVADLKALGARRPVVFASSGVGSTDYFATKVFSTSVGFPVRLVTGYDESPNSVIAVTRGDVDCVVHSLATLKQLAATDLVRILFAFQEKASIPGVQDALSIGKPDLGNIFQWRPVCAPPALAGPILTTLSNALIAAAKSPEAASWAASVGTELFPLDHTQTTRMIVEQSALVAKWASVL